MVGHCRRLNLFDIIRDGASNPGFLFAKVQGGDEVGEKGGEALWGMVKEEIGGIYQEVR